MGKSKHTPGPWRLVIGAGSKGYAGNYEIITAVSEEHEANARLIVAAPDLLAALESREWVGGQGSQGQFCPFCRGLYPDHREDCVRQAAIAKARGEPQ